MSVLTVAKVTFFLVFVTSIVNCFDSDESASSSRTKRQIGFGSTRIRPTTSRSVNNRNSVCNLISRRTTRNAKRRNR